MYAVLYTYMLLHTHICWSMQVPLRIKNPQVEHTCYITHIYAGSCTCMLVYVVSASKYILMSSKNVLKGTREEVDKWVEEILLKHLPDITDFPTITEDMLGFYKKKNKKDRRKPHYLLGGITMRTS